MAQQSPNAQRMELARQARALEAAGRSGDAARLLIGQQTNLTAHDPRDPLPCLCRHCLNPGLSETTLGQDAFYRDFALAEGRVLFYWVPAELPRSAGLSEAVADRVGANLKGAAARRRS